MAEGVQEWEVTRAGVNAMIAALGERWGERAELLDTWAWLQSGPINTDGAHNPTTTRELQRGDILTLNCFPMTQVLTTLLYSCHNLLYSCHNLLYS